MPLWCGDRQVLFFAHKAVVEPSLICAKRFGPVTGEHHAATWLAVVLLTSQWQCLM
jgi:hypothetical protein